MLSGGGKRVLGVSAAAATVTTLLLLGGIRVLSPAERGGPGQRRTSPSQASPPDNCATLQQQLDTVGAERDGLDRSLRACQNDVSLAKERMRCPELLGRDWDRSKEDREHKQQQQQQQQQPGGALASAWMSPAEIALVTAFIQPSHTYVEWGTGGSTFHFAVLARKAYSIEHSSAWCAEVGALLEELALESVALHCHPVAPGDNGWPGGWEEGSYTQFRDYVDAIDGFGLEHGSVDAVLVDGRARASCAIKVLPYLHDRSVVFFHDFWNRPYYHIVLQYYTEIASVKLGQSLVVLRPKPKEELIASSRIRFGQDYPPILY